MEDAKARARERWGCEVYVTQQREKRSPEWWSKLWRRRRDGRAERKRQRAVIRAAMKADQERNGNV
jgi:hypothetical protein